MQLIKHEEDEITEEERNAYRDIEELIEVKKAIAKFDEGKPAEKNKDSFSQPGVAIDKRNRILEPADETAKPVSQLEMQRQAAKVIALSNHSSP